jgi:hypothetical protein
MVDNQGNIYATGTVGHVDQAQVFSVLTVKFDPNGSRLWQMHYEDRSLFNIPGGRSEAKSMALDNLKNVYVAGLSTDDAHQIYDLEQLAIVNYEQSPVIGQPVKLPSSNNPLIRRL